jgi:signal transduction histidine kinase
MRKGGLEPPRREPLDPKSSASASSATFAHQLDCAVGQGSCQWLLVSRKPAQKPYIHLFYNTAALSAVRQQPTSTRLELAEAERVEKALAIARVIFAVASALAIYIDPTQPFFRYSALTYIILTGYTLYSFLLFFPSLVLSHPTIQLQIQMIDVLGTSVLIVGTGGITSPFFVFYTFALVSAAYRWGFWESIWNGILVALLFFIFSVISFDGTIVFVQPKSEVNGVIIRSTYLILMSVVLGYLAENDKRLRSENALIARAMSKAKAEFGLTQSMQASVSEIRAFYDADAAVFVSEELATGRIFVLGCPANDVENEFGRFVELDPKHRFFYFFAVNGESWYSVKQRNGIHEARFLDSHGRRMQDRQIEYPREFVSLNQFQSLLGTKIDFGQELTGRLLILNPKLKVDRWQELAFMQRVVRSVMPTLYNVYLWRRLRSRAGAMERARLGRDLHDGVLQSMIGLEMQLDVVKHRIESDDTAKAATDVARIQQLLTAEIKEVRNLMNALRQPRLEASELVNFMSEQVDKFARETGISAKFVAETDRVPLPSEVCREMVQILQEALMNVRKHSGAKHLLVRLSAPEDDLNLAIIDDGRGFDFEGRLSHSQLDEKNLGPFVIKERVRLIRGELEIESVPGHGARLDVRLPKRIYA